MTATSQQHQAELHTKLWDMANSLRGQMEASEFKNYILGIIFYRFLSEKTEETVEIFLKNDPGETYDSIWAKEEDRDAVKGYLVDTLGYAIEPQHLFSSFIADINTNDFNITTLIEAINTLNASTVGTRNQDSLDHLFDDLDLVSSKLGKTVAERTALISRILQHISEIPFKHNDVEIDVLGDAYEYMISKFAATAGKSAGEFYTPQQVSRILAKIVAGDKKELKTVYDPTCGSGSLLLRVARETKVHSYYGQELTSSTYNLARMNMMLHGVSHEDFNIKNDNTLIKPQHLDQKFEAIVANPPYSAHWDSSLLDDNDPRFSSYGKKAPKTKADFAFVQHMLYQLDDNGTMAVVLPHGVLFRGDAEGVIRQQIIEKNYLDAVIGLPANIFFGTSIPTSILVFKKCREAEDSVLFIDASKEFEKGKNSNALRDVDVDKIVEAYKSRNVIDKFAREVSLKEIKDNGYNLNIPRYVDSSIAEEIIDLSHIEAELLIVNNGIQKIDTKVAKMVKSMRFASPVELYSRKLYELILETAPTLQKVAFVYYNSGIEIFTHDGNMVESHVYHDYPIEMQELQPFTKDLLRYLETESFSILLSKNISNTTVKTSQDYRLEAVIWTDFNDLLKGVKLNDAEKWDIIEKSHAASPSSITIRL